MVKQVSQAKHMLSLACLENSKQAKHFSISALACVLCKVKFQALASRPCLLSLFRLMLALDFLKKRKTKFQKMPAKREREEINVDEVSESFGLSQTSQGDEDDFFEHQMQREVAGKFAQGERIFVCRKRYPTLSSGAFDQGRLVPLGRGFQGVFKAQNGQPAMSRHRKMHFEKSSPKVDEPRQTTLEEFSSRDEMKKSDVAQLFSVLNLSFRCVENPVVRKALGPLLRSSGVAPNRKAIREVILCEAKNARRELVSRMRRCSVSLALDGGTIRRRTFINFTVGFAGSVHFWRTARVTSTKSSVIMALIAKEIEELAADEVYVISIVSDNAALHVCD